MSGVYLLTVFIPLMRAGIAGGWSVAITGRYKPALILGWCILSLSAGLLTLLDSHSSAARWITFQILTGLGCGILVTTTIPAIQAPLPETDVALATATWSFVRSLGTIWGGAIPAAVFNSRLDSLAYQIGDPEIRNLLSSGGANQHGTARFMTSLNDNPELKAELVGGYTQALKREWQVLIGFALSGVPLAFVIKEIKLRTTLETDFGLKDKHEPVDLESHQPEVLPRARGQRGQMGQV